MPDEITQRPVPQPGQDNQKATPDASQRDLSQRISAKWAFALCAFVVICSLGAAMYVLFAGTSPSILQARLAITFACFSIACVIGLLFASTAQRSQTGGTLGVLSLVIVGPGAFFIACLLIYNSIFPENLLELKDPMSLQKLSELTTDVEKRAGWVDLESWKQNIKNLLPLFQRDEQSSVDQFLSTVYYHGNDNHKLNTPLIQTAFIYGNPTVDNKIPRIKIQRISGYKAKETAWIYFGATSPGSTPSVKMFVRHPSGQVDISKDSQNNWLSVSDDPAECLIVGVYPPIDIHEGDILMINPTKYLKAGTGSSADLAIFSIVPRLDPKLWEIHCAGVLQGDNLPLLFRQFISQEKQNDPGQITTDEAIVRWLSWLDATQKSDTTDPDTKAFLTSALDILHQVSPETDFAHVFNSDRLWKASYHLSNLQNPVIGTFLWDAPRSPIADLNGPKTSSR
jgi:hypothetical protein